MFKPKKGWLGEKRIPLGPTGDPEFKVLQAKEESLQFCSVLAQFTEEEVVYLVNKQLYALGYQREVHRKRAQAEAEFWAPVKEMVKKKFGVSWLKATEEQVKWAVEWLKEEREEK